MQKTHVTFFGASVTEQAVHHVTKEMTGFVSYFETHLAEDLGFEVSRVSAGSSDMTDAALVYVEKVLELAPDICVLDWVTPLLMDCDPRYVEQLYLRLLSAGIWPVTVYLPRRDRVQSQIPLAKKMTEVAERYGLPVYDFGLKFSAQELMETVLRDVVHTSAEGAKRYAEEMAAMLGDLPIGPFPETLERPPFFVTELPVTEGTERTSCKRIEITADPASEESVEFSIMMEQRVGPYSPVAEVRWGKTEPEITELEIWDPWCHRERQCLKKIAPWQTGIFDKVDIRVSATTPSYGRNPVCERVPLEQRQMRPRGKIFLVSTEPRRGRVALK